MAIDYVNYVLGNPDLRENVEALGLTNAEIAEWGDWHWNAHGEDEGRLNTPDAQDFAPGFTQTLGPEHYQERDVEEVLQASVRAGYKGPDAEDTEMWEAREKIADEWNLGQYTAAGWNLDPDQPYRTGILGDTIEVNRDIGQLVPMAAGDQRFLQDRYVDASIASDFPVGWTTPENTWAAAAPQQLGNYWDVLTNAVREDGVLRRVDPYDPTTAVGPSVSPGPRGSGNIRVDGTTGPAGTISTTGPPNPTVPSFGYPQYQDWTRFMPTNFQLAEGGGMHYQPGAWGNIPVTGGPTQWAGPNASYPNWGDAAGGYANDVAIINAGGATTTGGPGPINPNIWGTDTTTGGGNTVTDAQGKTWIMSNGQWIPATSELGSILAAGDTPRHPLSMYDAGGAWVGAEGFGPGNINPAGDPGWVQTKSWSDVLGNLTSSPMFSGVNALSNIFSPSTTAQKYAVGANPNWQGEFDVRWGEPEVDVQPTFASVDPQGI
jgi:hypothetical protein